MSVLVSVGACWAKGEGHAEADPSNDCGPQCVKYLSRYFGRPVTLEEAYRLFGVSPEKPSALTNMLMIKTALEHLGLHCYGFLGDYRSLSYADFHRCAFVAALREHKHFVVIARALQSQDWLWIDPSRGMVHKLDPSFFSKGSDELPFLAVSRDPIQIQPADADAPVRAAGSVHLLIVPAFLGTSMLLFLAHAVRSARSKGKRIGPSTPARAKSTQSWRS